MRWPWWAWILLVVPWMIILSMVGYIFWWLAGPKHKPIGRPEQSKSEVTVPHDTYQKLLKLKEKGKR